MRCPPIIKLAGVVGLTASAIAQEPTIGPQMRIDLGGSAWRRRTGMIATRDCWLGFVDLVEATRVETNVARHA